MPLFFLLMLGQCAFLVWCEVVQLQKMNDVWKVGMKLTISDH